MPRFVSISALAALVGALWAAAAGWWSPAALAQGEVNVYSARKEALIRPLLDAFTVQTGITVNLASGGERMR